MMGYLFVSEADVRRLLAREWEDSAMALSWQ